MPPRTRTRGAKALKENADVENNCRVTGKSQNPSRKVFADKTNSLSDDNETVNEIKKVSTKLSLAIDNNGRPRRQKRLPPRFKENQVLKNLSNRNNSIISTTEKAPETANELSSKENNQETSQKQAPKLRKKAINRVKNKNTTPLTNFLETQEKDSSTRKDRMKHQNNTKSFTSENIMTTKSVHSKKGNVVVNKRKIPNQNKQLKSSKTKPKQAQRKDTSELKDKSQNSSKNSEKFATSNTFTPLPYKDPNILEKSLIINRPKRIHRLPSRFDDHSVSPSKFIPVEPCHASTPLLKKQSAKQTQTKLPNKISIEKSKSHSIELDKNLSDKTSPDSNNNPKSTRSARLKAIPKVSLVKKSPIKGSGKRLLDKSLSFKILEGNKKSKDDSDKLDVYEFTFDPDEEPLRQKKKKKRVVKKNPSKPKTVTFKNNYDKNISKAMAALKDAVAKYVHPKDPDNNKIQAENVKSNTQVRRQHDNQNKIQLDSNTKPQNIDIENPNRVIQPLENTNPIICNVNANTNTPIGNNGDKSVHENLPSIRIEDIEADCEISYHDDINYSPANSPRPSSLIPMAVTQNFNAEDKQEHIERAIHNNDPLNLQDDISFFDDQPAASSSMNVSVRHPLASPWRVEFGSLPIRWQANTYLKPNMTPAVESSFISSEDSNKKKHVYVNMIPQTNESLPQIIENSMSNLKQTSIISFIKEVAERNANKKKRGKSVSPIKASALFEDITNKIVSDDQKTTSKKGKNKAIIEETAYKNVSNSSSNTSNDKENIRVTRKRKNENSSSKLPAKSPRKEKDKNVTYFGFDDSENHDQENILPNKNIDNRKVRALRSRSKALQEINGQIEPARAVLSLAAKNKITSSSEAVKQIYEEVKSAEDTPQFLENNDQQNTGVTNVAAIQNVDNYSEEGESVHLFEDIDVVHYLKPTRKSYGKAKKVTFRQRSVSDSETQASDVDNHVQSSDEDDLADLTFTMPQINQEKKKVVRKKKIMSKKEEKEADEWAAGFNSMCEDVEDFPLVVE